MKTKSVVLGQTDLLYVSKTLSVTIVHNSLEMRIRLELSMIS